MQLGVARLGLPASFAGSSYSAVQDVDNATVTVTLTAPDGTAGGAGPGASITAKLWVSPLAPVVWTELSYTAPAGSATGSAGGGGGGDPITITLNTTVRDHFYHRSGAPSKTFPWNLCPYVLPLKMFRRVCVLDRTGTTASATTPASPSPQLRPAVAQAAGPRSLEQPTLWAVPV